jgi:hypothetical protein
VKDIGYRVGYTFLLMLVGGAVCRGYYKLLRCSPGCACYASGVCVWGHSVLLVDNAHVHRYCVRVCSGAVDLPFMRVYLALASFDYA